jgi:hypothetical protein
MGGVTFNLESENLVHASVLSLTSFVPLGKSLNFSVPHFPL